MNRLSQETSPYLLQHADNPVDWYPWGEDALARARELDRPILLSIGYSACHWCHVMEHESFEDAGTAQVMNDLFVPVKVDREERPDLDALYMGAVVALTGHGGWPMTVFLTPGGEPFYGGTYYPPEPRGGLPSFRQVMHGVSSAWQERREAVVGQAAELTAALAAPSWRADATAPTGDEALLTDALLVLRAQLDERNGGFGGAPKFPPHAVLPFLLRMHVRSGSTEALRMASSTLAHMANGGICDQVGGGFHRYAVDAIWLVPHFEKMLYDNALLARAYTEAHVVTGEPRWREVAEQTLDYMLRDLLLEHGGFASAQDADTEGEEGTTYTWTPAQLEEALPPELAEVAARLWGVSDEGNFEGATVLSRVSDPAEAGADPATLANLRARLLEARLTRPQPALDDKALASWNGMALAALARAGAALGETRYVDAARGTAEFLLGPLSRADGGLWRTHRAGRSQVTGFLDDHAQVANGLLELHRATGERRWLDEARRLARLAVERFGDEAGGFFDTAGDAERLVARRKDVDDNPTPSGTSTLAGVLVQLAAIDEEERLAELARAALAPVRSALARAPSAFGHALGVLDDLTRGHRTLVLAGATPESELARVALERFEPGLPVVFGDGEGPGAPGGKLPVEGRPAAYLCQSGTCLPAVTAPAELAALLNPA